MTELCADERRASGANLDSKGLTRKIFRNRYLLSNQFSVLSSQFSVRFSDPFMKTGNRRVRRLVPIPDLEEELHEWAWKYVIAVIVVCDLVNIGFTSRESGVVVPTLRKPRRVGQRQLGFNLGGPARPLPG